MSNIDPPGIRLVRDGYLASVTLDRPERHNALEASDVDRMLDILDEIDSDDSIRVAVLTGAGDRTFCSGASLDQMSTGQMSGRRFDTLTDRLAALRVPTVCALNGDVFGGGAELALCCDFRIGVEGMRMSVPAAVWGGATRSGDSLAMCAGSAPGSPPASCLAAKNSTARNSCVSGSSHTSRPETTSPAWSWHARHPSRSWRPWRCRA